jgi:hypothetical protein
MERASACKPAGRCDVSLYMMASDAIAVIDFAKAIFGAETKKRHGDKRGGVMDAAGNIGWMQQRKPEEWVVGEAGLEPAKA